MPAWHVQGPSCLSICHKVVSEHHIATAKLIWCQCSLHLFVRWSIRKIFLSYILINTVYFIPVYSQIHVDVWSKVEGSFIYLENQETSVIVRCVQKTNAECWMCKLGNAHILSLLFYYVETTFSLKNFPTNTCLSNWCSRYVQMWGMSSCSVHYFCLTLTKTAG